MQLEELDVDLLFRASEIVDALEESVNNKQGSFTLTGQEAEDLIYFFRAINAVLEVMAGIQQ